LVAGRRSFFKYRDLGVTAASSGKIRAQVTIGADGMTQPTGWHYHVCEGQFLEISVPADMGTVACDPPEGWSKTA
jgi:hypothetical protein